MRLVFMFFGVVLLVSCAGAPPIHCADAVDRAAHDHHVSGGFEGAAVCTKAPGLGHGLAATEYLNNPHTDRCDIEAVFQHGARGAGFPGACARVSADETFLAAYKAGRQLRFQKKKVVFLKTKLKHTKFDLNEINHRTAEIEAALMSEQTSRHKRSALTRQLKAMALEHREKANEFRALADEYESAKTVLKKRNEPIAAGIRPKLNRAAPVKDAAVDF